MTIAKLTSYLVICRETLNWKLKTLPPQYCFLQFPVERVWLCSLQIIALKLECNFAIVRKFALVYHTVNGQEKYVKYKISALISHFEKEIFIFN